MTDGGRAAHAAHAAHAHPVDGVDVRAFTVPTSAPQEQDGTKTWSSTTAVVVMVHAGGTTGLGWTYGPTACGEVVRAELAPVIGGHDATDVRARWLDMVSELRNAGRPGIGAMAVSAVDIALWDLRARLLDLSLLDLWGAARDAVPVYGSGGFTDLDEDALVGQLEGWVEQGMGAVKMKVGRHPDQDVDRVATVRRALGEDVDLMVDANGAYTVQQALARSRDFAELGVVWHEEPVSSDDLRGLRNVRQRISAGVEVAAGEYAYDVFHLRDLVDADAVDVLQADVTRIGGFTAFLDAAALARANHVELSTHCAPALSTHVCCAAPAVRHAEWFHDHARLEPMLFDGVPDVADGSVRPDRDRPGHGLSVRADADRFAVG